MANSEISKLKSALGIGARANKYSVDVIAKGGITIGEKGNTLCKSTTIPGRSFADIDVWHQGRLTTIAGDALYDGTWSVTYMDDEEHSLRGDYIKWMEYIDSIAKNSREASSHDDYMGKATVTQLSTVDNSPKAIYTFEDIYPKAISDSSLADESSDLIEFTVEFNFSSWSKDL